MNPKAILQLRSGNVHPALRRIVSHIEDLTITLQDGNLIMDVKWCNPPHAMNPLLAFPSPICECFRSHSPTIAVLKDPAQLEALSQIQFASGQTAPTENTRETRSTGSTSRERNPGSHDPSGVTNILKKHESQQAIVYIVQVHLLPYHAHFFHAHPATYAPIHPSTTPSTSVCMHITCFPLKVTSIVAPGGAEVWYDSTCVHVQRPDMGHIQDTVQIGDTTKAASASSYLLALDLPTYPLIHGLVHPPISCMCPFNISNHGSQIMLCRMCTHPNALWILHLPLM